NEWKANPYANLLGQKAPGLLLQNLKLTSDENSVFMFARKKSVYLKKQRMAKLTTRALIKTIFAFLFCSFCLNFSISNPFAKSKTVENSIMVIYIGSPQA
ncbi:MAG: hypothetical protein RSD17_02565, partial [Oscillospiraceae bacterium]